MKSAFDIDIEKMPHFTVTKEKMSKSLKYKEYPYSKKTKQYGSQKGHFSTLNHRYECCKNNPIHPTQPGLVAGYYWGTNWHDRNNLAPVKIFIKGCPIGRNIKKSAQQKKMRKLKTYSHNGYGYKYTYKFTHMFNQLEKRLDSTPGLKLGLRRGYRWVQELGKKYPIIGG